MNKPKLFVPSIWANKIKENFLSSILEKPQPTRAGWEVWFAWYPVKIAIITRYEEIHDELIIEGYSRWCWLRCVSKREFGGGTEYGPATNAITQPQRAIRFYRGGYGV